MAGLTLVELAVTLFLVGIIFGAVARGYHLVSTARALKVVEDTRQMMEVAYAFHAVHSRFPGDCNGDGFVDLGRLDVDLSDFSERIADGSLCGEAASSITAQWRDVISAGMLKGTPRQLAENGYGGARYLARVVFPDGTVHNGVVQKNVPCYVAEFMDLHFDGVLNPGAGSVRKITHSGVVAESDSSAWCGQEKEMRVDLVCVIDR